MSVNTVVVDLVSGKTAVIRSCKSDGRGQHKVVPIRLFAIHVVMDTSTI